MNVYEVQTRFGNDWENCWHEENGQPTYFLTREQAQQAIDDHVRASNLYYKVTCKTDYRIRKVE